MKRKVRSDQARASCPAAEPPVIFSANHDKIGKVLRVVERKSDGGGVREAKLHQTGMLNSHEVCVMPTLTMRQGEEPSAVCFSIPTNTPRIKYIYGHQGNLEEKMERVKKILSLS